MMMIEPGNEVEKQGSKKLRDVGNSIPQNIDRPQNSFDPSPSAPLASPSIRLFISTGEVSGDLQGSLLVQALQRQAAKRG
jgi:lipid-A-disaccharide synthase